jgi:hypothetical protein
MLGKVVMEENWAIWISHPAVLEFSSPNSSKATDQSDFVIPGHQSFLIPHPDGERTSSGMDKMEEVSQCFLAEFSETNHGISLYLSQILKT